MLALYGEEPDCNDCIPEILPANQDAWRVFPLVNDQHIMGFGGPVALNMQPVFEVMDRLGINDQIDCISKVKTAYRAYITKVTEK